MAETTALAGATTESLRNIELVKSLGLAQQEIARLNATTDKILQLELKKVRYLRSLSFIQGTCVNALRTSILFLMLYLIFAQQITVGQFFSLCIYSFFIFGPLQELGNVINVYRETEVSLDELRADPEDAPGAASPRIPVRLDELLDLAFEDVTLHAPDRHRARPDDVSFRAARGETIAFVGPSGAGKTTLVKLLVGLYRPQAGRILYNGHARRRGRPRRACASGSASSPRTPSSSRASIRENLLFVRPDASDAECLEVLRKAACDSLLARADKGLDTVIGEGGVKVSGERSSGSRSRAPCCASPHLLVFDEATSSLDSLTEEEISRTIRDVAASRDVPSPSSSPTASRP